MTNLSRFSTPKRHYYKLMSTPAMEKIHLVSIYELGMPKIYHAKKPTFESLDSLIDHQIKGSRPSLFSTLNLRKKGSSVLKRPSIASCVEAANPKNLVEVEVNSSNGKIKPPTWFRFKNPITTFNKGITTNLSYCCINMAAWSLLI